MAHFKSQVITDLDAARPVLQNVRGYGGTLKVRTINFSIVAATHGAGDIFELCRVGAHERPIAIYLWVPAITNMSDVNIGLRPKPSPGVDTAAFTTDEDDCLCDGVPFSIASNGGQIMGVVQGTNAITPVQIGAVAFWQLVADLAAAEPVRGAEFSLILETVADPTTSGGMCIQLVTADPN